MAFESRRTIIFTEIKMKLKFAARLLREFSFLGALNADS